MKIVKYILIGTGILIALLLGARALFSVQIGEALFRSAVKANLGQSALADAPDGLSAILVGTGSPLPDPGRVGPMTVVAAGDRIFIIDAGFGPAVWRTSSAMGQCGSRLPDAFPFRPYRRTR